LQEFIRNVFNDGIFLMDFKEFQKIESLVGLSEQSLYYPHLPRKEITEVQLLNARSFVDFLGPRITPAPWLTEWESEIRTIQEQMVLELGQEQANELMKNSRSAINGNGQEKDSGNSDVAKIAYW
jgi:hypothetical protein